MNKEYAEKTFEKYRWDYHGDKSPRDYDGYYDRSTTSPEDWARLKQDEEEMNAQIEAAKAAGLTAADILF